MNRQEVLSLIHIIIQFLRETQQTWLLRQVTKAISDMDVSESSFNELVELIEKQENLRFALSHLLDAVQFGIIDRIAIAVSVDDFFRSKNMSYSVTDVQQPEGLNNSPRLAVAEAINLQNTVNNIRQLISNG